MLHCRVAVRTRAAAGRVAVGQVGDLDVRLMPFPHRHVEHFPVRLLVVEVARQAAVDWVFNDLKIINHQIDPHIAAVGEQVHVVFRKGKRGRTQGALQFAAEQSAVQPTGQRAARNLSVDGEIIGIGQRIGPRRAVGKPIVALCFSDVRDELVLFIRFLRWRGRGHGGLRQGRLNLLFQVHQSLLQFGKFIRAIHGAVRETAAANHTVKRVVILGTDGIKLVIVTARTGDGHALKRLTEHVDLVVDDLRLIGTHIHRRMTVLAEPPPSGGQPAFVPAAVLGEARLE